MISARKNTMMHHQGAQPAAGTQDQALLQTRSPPESGACAQGPSAPCVLLYGENLISTLCHRVPATDKQRGLHVVPKPFKSQSKLRS